MINMQLIDAVKSRKSIKKFTGKKVDWRKIIQAIDSARFAPMAGNMFSLKFVIVQDQDSLEKIANASQQPFIKDASAVVLAVSDRDKVKKMYDYNNKGFAAQQAGAAIENLLLALTEKKIDHCWVGFFDDDQVHEHINIPEEYVIEAIIAIGVKPKMREQKKPKPDLENIIFFDKYGNKYLAQESRVKHENT